jgi:hypothetical protein
MDVVDAFVKGVEHALAFIARTGKAPNREDVLRGSMAALGGRPPPDSDPLTVKERLSVTEALFELERQKSAAAYQYAGACQSVENAALRELSIARNEIDRLRVAIAEGGAK